MHLPLLSHNLKCTTVWLSIAVIVTVMSWLIQFRILLHCYCAGISRQHYKTLIDNNSTPFVCFVCTQLLHKAEIQTLLSELEVLKSECQELWAELQASRADTPATPTPAGNESTQPAAFQALKKDIEQLQDTVEAQSKRYAVALKTGGRSKSQPKKKSHYDKTNRTVNNQSESSQTPSAKHSPPKHSFSKPKVSVSGARKVLEPWERPCSHRNPDKTDIYEQWASTS